VTRKRAASAPTTKQATGSTPHLKEAKPIMTANAKAKRTVIQLGEKLTVAEICADLQISRRTFYEWRMKGTGPECFALPNGELRVTVADYERWLDARKNAA
jgi:predicted DNA-binding transcriptional regulator AlpA